MKPKTNYIIILKKTFKQKLHSNTNRFKCSGNFHEAIPNV